MEIKDSKGKTVATVTAERIGGEVIEGVWLTLKTNDGTQPTLCLVLQPSGEWYVGAYRDAAAKDVNACDFAVSLTKDGPVVQAAKGGAVVSANLYDLIAKALPA